MANAYYDYNNGSAGNSGLTALLPKATRGQAASVAGAGDKVICLDGAHVHEADFFAFNDNRLERSENYRGATLRANATYATRVARVSGIIDQDVSGFTFDGQSGLGGAVAYAFGFTSSGAVPRKDIVSNGKFIIGEFYGINIEQTIGIQRIINAEIVGDIDGTGVRAIRAPSNVLGSDGNHSVIVDGLKLNNNVTAVGKVLELAKGVAIANTVDLSIKGLNGTLTVSADSTIVDIKTEDIVSISGFNLTLDVDDGVSCSGLLVRGSDAANPTSLASIASGTLNFNADTGFGIMLGSSTAAGNGISNGVLSGFTVRGKYTATGTPHNCGIGRDVTGVIRGVNSIDGYVGIILSMCADGTAENNLVFDPFGPAIYIKGTTIAAVKYNIAICSGKFIQRDRGIIAVAPQDGTDTANADFLEGLVIVADLDKIHSLASVEDANQVCSFTRYTYIVPEEQYVEGNNYFTYNNGAGAANESLATWNAHVGNLTVTDDIIVPMPQEEIAKLIANSNPSSNGSTVTGDGAAFWRARQV